MSKSFRNPRCAAFFDHWHALCADALMPHWHAFSAHPPFAHLPYTLIFEVQEDDLLVRFMGTRLATLWQQEFTGTYLARVVEASTHARILADVRRVCAHPVGASIAGATTTSKGRTVACESLCLPLATDEKAPPRCVLFRHLGEELGHDEVKTGFSWPEKPQWIDIGAGVPQ